MSSKVIEKYLESLKATSVELSDSALRVSAGDAFTYGLVCGKHQGLRIAIRLLEETIGESKNDK